MKNFSEHGGNGQFASSNKGGKAKSIAKWGLVGALLAGGGTAIHQVTDTSANNGHGARVFRTSYNDEVNSFLAKNPNWIRLSGVNYAESGIGKMKNMPYEAPPLIQPDPQTGNVIDIAWPQGSDAKMISLLDLMKTNKLPSYLAMVLTEVMYAEDKLSSPSLQQVRQLAPELVEKALASLSSVTKEASNSAAKVKKGTWNDFPPKEREIIMNSALKMKIIPADRSRVMFSNATDKHAYVPLYQFLGYKNVEEAKVGLSKNKDIKTTGEVGIAFAMAILARTQEYIAQGEKAIGVTREDNGTIRAAFVPERYASEILPIIKKSAKYSGKYSDLANQSSFLLKEMRSSPRSKAERKALQSRLPTLRTEYQRVNQEMKDFVKSHYTVSRKDINMVGAVLSSLNRVGAFWPTNIPRAFGMIEGKLGTYDQYMLNILSINQALNGVNSSDPKLLHIDGDAGDSTKVVASRFGVVAGKHDNNEKIYTKGRNELLGKIVALRGEFEKTSVSNPLANPLFGLMTASFEHRYIVYKTLEAFLATIPDSTKKSQFSRDLQNSWNSFVSGNMKPDSLNVLYRVVINSKEFQKSLGLSPQQAANFYSDYLMSKLMATVISVGYSGVVAPLIQSTPKSKFQNTSNTAYRMQPMNLKGYIAPLITGTEFRFNSAIITNGQLVDVAHKE